MAVAAKGKQDCLYLGNSESQRDWGHAKDYVRPCGEFYNKIFQKIIANWCNLYRDFMALLRWVLH
jgi:hypothetical protein